MVENDRAKILKHQEERTREAREISRAEERAGEDVGSEGNCGPSGDWSPRGCNTQTGRVVADPRSNI